MKWFRRWFCRHRWHWFNNVSYGELYYCGATRSFWRCTKCGAWQQRPEYHEPTPFDALISDRMSKGTLR